MDTFLPALLTTPTHSMASPHYVAFVFQIQHIYFKRTESLKLLLVQKNMLVLVVQQSYNPWYECWDLSLLTIPKFEISLFFEIFKLFPCSYVHIRSANLQRYEVLWKCRKTNRNAEVFIPKYNSSKSVILFSIKSCLLKFEDF